MNFRDLLFPLSFVFLIVAWGLNYFFVSKKTGTDIVHAGQMVQGVQTNEYMQKPVLREILFADETKKVCATTNTIDNKHIIAQFSSCGAGIETLTFKRIMSGQERLLTILEASEQERMRHAFLVAFADATPYYYDLVSENQTDEGTVLTYAAHTEKASIEKQFLVHHNRYQIDMTLTVEPKNNNKIQPRIYFPGPAAIKQQLISQISDRPVMGIYLNDAGSIKKMKPADLDTPRWASPEIFGVEDRYFVTALVKDPAHFVQRAYYAVEGPDVVIAILEGPEITQKTTWTTSFYCGPKESSALGQVDSRLKETLDYGWFSYLCQFFLYILNVLYGYVKNYGWAIVILTIILRLILVPFTLGTDKAARSAAELKKKLAYIEQKYKHDRETYEREKMALYSKHGMPGLASCLPLLLQVPMFIALQRLLSNAIELHQAPFLWISDLSAKDPYYIFPLLFALAMILQALSAPATIRERFVTLFFAVLVSGFIANFSAGVTIFMAISMLFGVVQAKIQRMVA